MLICMLKRDMQLFCRCLVVAIVFALTLGAIGVGTAAAVGSGGSDAFKQPMVAVVDEENSLISRMLISFVEGSDFVAPLFRVERMKEKEALRRFAEGSCSAIICLPENFVDDVSYGRTSGGTIRLSESLGSYSYIVEAAARFGEKMLAAGQYGVFVGEDLIRDYGKSREEHEQFLLAVNAKLLKEALNSNDNYYEILMTDYSGTSLSAESYYLTAWVAFVLSLSGLFFWKLYRSDMKQPIVTRLAVYGVREWQMAVGKVLFPMLFQMILLIPVVIVLSGPENKEWFRAVPAALLALLLSATLSFAFAVNMKNEVVVSAFLSFIGLLLCGGVIPRPLLPEKLAGVGDLLPVGVVRTLLSPCFGGEMNAWSFVTAVVYLVFAVVMIRIGIRRIKMGGAT